MHEIFFCKYFLSKNKKTFNNFIDLLINAYLKQSEDNGIFPISDPFHLFKCFRGRLFNYDIQLFEKGGIINSGNIEKGFQIGKAMTDKSELSGMMGYCLIKRFLPDNQLIVDRSGSALRHHLKVIIKHIGLDPNEYSWHSFRRGVHTQQQLLEYQTQK